jgi:dihydrofolate reductase
MGRKTFLSIGRPLPKRANIVLSRSSEFDRANSFWQREETVLLWAANRESALFFADVISNNRDRSDIFVIGGSEMYNIFNDLFNKIYLTEVLTGRALRRMKDDAVFEYNIDHRQWRTVETQEVPAGPNDDYPSRYTVLERRTKRVRYVEIEDYFTEAESRRSWLSKQLKVFRHATKDSTKPLAVQYAFQLTAENAQS